MSKFWNQINNLKHNYPEITCLLENNDGVDGEVFLVSLKRNENARKGMGREFLKKLCFIFDSYGYNCELRVEEWCSVDKLVSFYKTVGFEEIDREEYDYVTMRRVYNRGHIIGGV